MKDDAAFGTLASRIGEQASIRPDRIAIDIAGTSLTYAALDRLGHRIAFALRRDGIRFGDAIGVLADNRIEYLALMVGAARSGVVLVPLPVAAGSRTLRAMVADSGCLVVFSDQNGDDQGIRRIDLDTEFERWLGRSDVVEPPAGVGAGATATIIYSSGTTGTPKGIVQSHGMRWRMLMNGAARGYTDATVTLLATPLYSNMTLASMMSTLGSGGKVALLRKFDAGLWLRTAAAQRANHATLAPVMIQRLLAHPDFDRTDLASFGIWYCMSAPFSPTIKAELLRRWSGDLVELYGMTEGGPSCMLHARAHPDKLATVGKPPAGAEIKILGADGNEVGPGEEGEVVGRSAVMMTGYHNRPDDTAAARWRATDGTIWQRSGDIGRLDADGFLTLVDRKKDMIISGGFNIYPSDIETVIEQYPGIVEAAVVGVPSEAWGETPVGFAVAPGGDADTIREWVNQRVGKMQRLADVRLVEALPRGSIGKVLKRELRDLYTAA